MGDIIIIGEIVRGHRSFKYIGLILKSSTESIKDTDNKIGQGKEQLGN